MHPPARVIHKPDTQRRSTNDGTDDVAITMPSISNHRLSPPEPGPPSPSQHEAH